ncbi:AAA family ATPase [Apilactobacillus timberlakei]|uniref:AAA family ATPase n=1 Tax=Apilactobacillus timberlakei TaxID=2008380 RepID=UPI00112E1AEA|nr:AAA family ATPase [Apilactobacillus timberlakei]TPR13207.1 hypothetical protein DYZ97_04790 [Apilactobacillus timberlakei]
MSTIILIRGNSGSGKTTVAKKLHQLLGSKSLLVSQDYIRRNMLHVKDKPGNLAINLIDSIIQYGIQNCNYIIVEGIFVKSIYENMLLNNLQRSNKSLSYYYDLSFEETIRRNNTKKLKKFSKVSMKNWFVPHDFLENKNEKIINEGITQFQMLNIILSDLDLNKLDINTFNKLKI